MAVFDKFKQWIDKALEKSQPNDGNVLDEQYQEQVDVERPPEELFKQNILMGDTARSEIVGQETASEDNINNQNDGVQSKAPEQEQVAFPEPSQNEANIPDFLKQDGNINPNDDDIALSAESSFVSVNPIVNDDSEAVAANVSASSSVGDNGSSDSSGSNNTGNPEDPENPGPGSNSDVSPVVDANITDNEINESASIGASVGLTAFAFDADGGDSVTGRATSRAREEISMDAETVEETVNDPRALDFETSS
ncbi:MAG: hypothetical protein AB8B92_11495, partial [Gammaproteobacteria bacterium]